MGIAACHTSDKPHVLLHRQPLLNTGSLRTVAHARCNHTEAEFSTSEEWKREEKEEKEEEKKKKKKKQQKKKKQ
jgi:hypothetical protein